MIEDAWIRHFKEKAAKKKELYKDGYESYIEKWVKRNHCKVRKKKKNKILMIWNNCIPLSDYRGKEVINLEYVICRRTIRRLNEQAVWLEFGHGIKKEASEVNNCVYKGKTGYINNYHERKLVSQDCECEAQAIDRQSTVGKPCEAADQILFSQKEINGTLIQVTESNNFSVDGTICRHSETNQESQGEECSTLSNSPSVCYKQNFRELFSISRFAEQYFNQRNSKNKDWKCDPAAFNHVSNVGKPCVASDPVLISQNETNSRRIQVIESINNNSTH
jgi:hypothetical protein